MKKADFQIPRLHSRYGEEICFYSVKRYGRAANALRSVDLARTQATRANSNGLGGTVNDCLYLTDVGLPRSVGLAMRVRNRLSKDDTLSANATLCHIDTSSMRKRACIFHENP